jgi:aldose 1-epimerase
MKGEPTLSIGAGNLRAEFWPGAGMLGVSLHYRGEEILRRVDDLESARQKGSTAGIPLLYPWANRLASLHYRAAGQDVQLDASSRLLHFDEHGLSMHGVPWGQLKWTIVEDKESSLLARLDWNPPEFLAVFPFPHTIELAAKIESDRLTVQTTVFANAGRSVPISFGFHPYFGIPQVARAQWRLKTPAMRKLLLDSRGIPTGKEEVFGPLNTLLGEASYDDGFAVLDEKSSFVLSGGPRSITVNFLEGFPYTQVFAPMGKDFIALEPMTAPTSALISGGGLRVLESGGQFRASFSIAVQSSA